MSSRLTGLLLGIALGLTLSLCLSWPVTPVSADPCAEAWMPTTVDPLSDYRALAPPEAIPVYPAWPSGARSSHSTTGGWLP